MQNRKHKGSLTTDRDGANQNKQRNRDYQNHTYYQKLKLNVHDKLDHPGTIPQAGGRCRSMKPKGKINRRKQYNSSAEILTKSSSPTGKSKDKSRNFLDCRPNSDPIPTRLEEFPPLPPQLRPNTNSSRGANPKQPKQGNQNCLTQTSHS